MTVGFYSGSFDPLTLGHADIIARSLKVVDTLVIGIGVHPGKVPMFSAEERIALIEKDVGAMPAARDKTIRVVTFDNLVVDAAREAGATLIIRGLRNSTDFDYEIQMAGMNGAMAPDIETMFFAATPEVSHIAGTLVRQIAKMGGDVGDFVSGTVADALKRKTSQTGR